MPLVVKLSYTDLTCDKLSCVKNLPQNLFLRKLMSFLALVLFAIRIIRTLMIIRPACQLFVSKDMCILAG